MFAWISRFNGKEPELGTENNTTYRGDLKSIMRYAAKYGKGFKECRVSIHNSESNKYGVADRIVTLYP